MLQGFYGFTGVLPLYFKEIANSLFLEKMQKTTLIYDGECPFCSRYARYVRLKGTVGNLFLVNARDGDHEAVRDVIARGFDLDQGMVVVIDGQYYHGEKALHVMALLGSRSGFFNRLNYRLFSSEKMSSLAYPFFRAFRNLALWLKQVKKIHS